MLLLHVWLGTKATYMRASNQTEDGAGAIENDVSHLLELLDLAFSVVLMLLMRFTLPSGYAIDTKEFYGTSRNFNLGSVGDEFSRGSLETYVVFKSVDKLFSELHGIDVDHISVHTNENLATSATVVDGRCVTVEFVGSVLECFLDDVRGNPTKEGLQFGEVRIACRRRSRLCCGDLMFMCIVKDIIVCSRRTEM